MPTLRVCFFSKFAVRCDEQVVAGLEARKVQELFSYLLLHRNQPHPRESLAALLWGDVPTAQSKKSLRQVLWQLQSALDAQTGRLEARVLLVEPEWVQFNAEASIWLDVTEFERGFACTQGLPGEDLDASRFAALQNAVQLYRGDLLEGWYQDWCLYERERLQNLYLMALDKLMAYCEAHQLYEDGLAYGGRILRYDRARERAHRRMMRLYYLSGNRTTALRQYEQCVATLQEELGVSPARRTVELCERIRADRLEANPPAHPTTTAPHEPEAMRLPRLLDRLRKFQSILSELQSDLQQDIQAVERLLKDQPESS
jgi:DNA-binding SARP family transcriptional activator